MHQFQSGIADGSMLGPKQHDVGLRLWCFRCVLTRVLCVGRGGRAIERRIVDRGNGSLTPRAAIWESGSLDHPMLP